MMIARSNEIKFRINDIFVRVVQLNTNYRFRDILLTL